MRPGLADSFKKVCTSDLGSLRINLPQRNKEVNLLNYPDIMRRGHFAQFP